MRKYLVRITVHKLFPAHSTSPVCQIKQALIFNVFESKTKVFAYFIIFAMEWSITNINVSNLMKGYNANTLYTKF